MSELAPTEVNVDEFLSTVENPGRRADAHVLLDLIKRATGLDPRMWGPSIVGFGSYHYRYTSDHEGDAPLAAFSPRKANLVVYLTPGMPDRGPELAKLGKHRAGKGCLYLGRLSNVDLGVLEGLIVDSKDFAAGL